MGKRWRAFWVCVVLLVPRQAGAEVQVIELPLVLHIAQRAGKPVVPDAFVAERVARANAIYAPYGVRFVVARTEALAERHAALETRRDRHALGRYARRGVIDCFVVESLRDVDDPSQLRRGVHWRSRTHAGTHFVVISSIAGPSVLAHELGHYLGNREHSAVPGNLMSYTPGEGLPVLDAQQQARVQETIAAYLASGELKRNAH